MAIFTGAGVAIVTPFKDNLEVDFDQLEKLIDFQIDGGIDAITVCGTTGESAALNHEEHCAAIEYCVKKVAGRVPVIAGTGSNDTSYALELCKIAEDLKVDGLLMVTPYYNKTSQRGLIKHYNYIADRVNTPIILYNVPSRTGVDIPISVYKRLSALPNIAGVKEATTDITKIAKIRRACPEDFYIWAGNDDQIVPVMSLGGKGVISVLSNLFPAETSAMTQAALAGDFDTAASLQVDLTELIELLFAEVNPIPVKYAMRYIGYDCGKCRLPLAQLSADTKRRIDAYFA